jgi:hypothetical protein
LGCNVLESLEAISRCFSECPLIYLADPAAFDSAARIAAAVIKFCSHCSFL